MKYDVDSIRKRKKINNRIKKIILIFIVILLYNLTLIYMSYINKFESPKFYKFEAFVITTSSMENTLSKDDAIIIEKCKEEDLHKNDIITYKINDNIVTHRIIDITDDKVKQYVTKGDNNNIPDNEHITYENIEGKMIFKIPKLGKILGIIKNGIIIILAIIIFLIMYLNSIDTKENSKRRRLIKKRNDEKIKNIDSKDEEKSTDVINKENNK